MWTTTEVVSVGIHNPPTVSLVTVDDGVDESEVEKLIQHLDERACALFVVHRGKRTATRQMILYLDEMGRAGTIK